MSDLKMKYIEMSDLRENFLENRKCLILEWSF